uniref:tRNA pseudouridine(38/39) synthase-like n=1 Tax=Phallusia mammillata TaxID=59560 RepID=A0A6F9DQQ0_9ASCI|nr:tRNA pseudouridine(38/39) synthase-like [Phallusia mammillata]
MMLNKEFCSLRRICVFPFQTCFQTRTITKIVQSDIFCLDETSVKGNKKGRVVWKEKDLKKLNQDELIKEVLFVQKYAKQLENRILTTTGAKLSTKRKNQAAKTDDFLACNYRRVALQVVYLGWKYSGLQCTKNSCASVEWMLTNALKKCRLVGEDLPVRYSRSGRTDKHVSSFCQVLSLLVRTRHTEDPHIVKWSDELKEKMESEINSESQSLSEINQENNIDIKSSTNTQSFSVESGLRSQNIKSKDCTLKTEQPTAGEYDYIKMINSALPPDIRVVNWAPVDHTFAARRNCQKREYHYHFWKGNFDVDKMQEAAQLLCGIHDFRNFCTIINQRPQFFRHIHSFDFIKLTDESDSGEMYYAKIVGSSFLYHQVRFMMSILFLIGLGKEEPSLIETLLNAEKTPSRPGYLAAPAYPLVLYNTEFLNLKWAKGPEAYTEMAQYFQTMWSKTITEAVIIKNLVVKLQDENKKNSELLCTEDDNNKEKSPSTSSDPNESEEQDSNFSLKNMYCRNMRIVCSMNNNPYKKVLDRPPCKSPADRITDWKENSSTGKWVKVQNKL